MPNSPDDIIAALAAALKQGPANITVLSRRAKINRITTSTYLESLANAGFVTKQKRGREYIFGIQANPEGYFGLAIEEEDSQTFATYYAHISDFCRSKFKREPTKTQVYKILFEVDKTLKLNLPIGWYKYGPMPVQIYRGDEKPAMRLPEDQLLLVKELTEKYCALEPIELIKRVYEQEHNALYLAKEQLFSVTDEHTLKSALIDIIKAAPVDVANLAGDFARVALIVGWDAAKGTWEKVWQAIALTQYRDDLRAFYPDIDARLNVKIESVQRDARAEIMHILENWAATHGTGQDFRFAVDKGAQISLRK